MGGWKKEGKVQLFTRLEARDLGELKNVVPD